MGAIAWTENQIERLKAMHADGLSAAQIAKNLNCGFSRNAVLGKIFRLGLVDKPAQRNAAPRPKRAAPKKLPPAPVLEAVAPIPLLEPETFAPDGRCKFIAADVALPGWQMCGHPVHKRGSPWCSHHRTICFQPNRPTDQKTAREADSKQTRIMMRMRLG